MKFVYVCYYQDVCGPCCCYQHYDDAYSYMLSLTDGPLIQLVKTGFHNIFKIKVIGEDAFRYFHIEMFDINPIFIESKDE